VSILRTFAAATLREVAKAVAPKPRADFAAQAVLGIIVGVIWLRLLRNVQSGLTTRVDDVVAKFKRVEAWDAAIGTWQGRIDGFEARIRRVEESSATDVRKGREVCADTMAVVRALEQRVQHLECPGLERARDPKGSDRA
jgi:hypothetical protein